MFAALQTEDMGLERRTFGVKKVSGAKNEQAAPDAIVTDAAPLTFRTPPEEVDAESAAAGGIQAGGADQKAKYEFDDGDLMTAFSMNYGMPYKFVASGASKPFEEGPWPVAECRRRLNWAQREFLDNKGAYVDLNEQLIFAYLEGQKIEYHDDGEEGLGPRIATLSLGGRAKMHLRMKLKHFVGCSKQAILTEERPVPGGIGGSEMDDKRLKAWEELQDLRYEKSTEYQKRRKELPRELGLLDKRVKKADDLVTITLSHGDIVIMEGYDVQRYLEHKVVPEGCLRFAMTCRTVLENHLKAEELPNYTVDVDETVYEGPKLGGDWGFGSLPA
jgi:alkylated DNA repair dioxygenase AlkB